MDIYEINFDGSILKRGFWIYIWTIHTQREGFLIYVGRTGDTSSPNAQSAFNRVSQHVDPNPNSRSNTLARNLRGLGISPESCKFKFTAIGPIENECDTMEAHIPIRNRIAALERRTADWFRNRGYKVLGNHPRPGDIDPDVWQKIESELTIRFAKLNGV
jgi:hypothetical protein